METPSALITGVVVVRTDFAAENPEAVSAFLDSYKESVDFVNGSTEEASTLFATEHAEDASRLIAEQGIVEKAPIAQKALPYCNITFIEGTEMKEKLSGYLNVLFGQNPKAVGGKLPADDFYYSR